MSEIDKLREALDGLIDVLDEYEGQWGNDYLAEKWDLVRGAATAKQEARAVLDELQAQLSAQPKLEWREPSTAPLDTNVLVILSAFGSITDGERTEKGWRINDSLCPGSHVLGWLPLDALPPTPKG